jgi:hypothetical protein
LFGIIFSGQLKIRKEDNPRLIIAQWKLRTLHDRKEVARPERLQSLQRNWQNAKLT